MKVEIRGQPVISWELSSTLNHWNLGRSESTRLANSKDPQSLLFLHVPHILGSKIHVGMPGLCLGLFCFLKVVLENSNLDPHASKARASPTEPPSQSWLCSYWSWGLHSDLLLAWFLLEAAYVQIRSHSQPSAIRTSAWVWEWNVAQTTEAEVADNPLKTSGHPCRLLTAKEATECSLQPPKQ